MTTIVVVRNVSNRMRGFLASTMVEVGVGVFLGVKISPAVRERILNVLSDWFAAEKEASLVIVWDDPNKPGGLAVKVMGWPPVELVEVNGILITRR